MAPPYAGGDLNPDTAHRTHTENLEDAATYWGGEPSSPGEYDNAILNSAFASLLSGMREDPLQHWMTNRIAGTFGYDPEYVDRYVRRNAGEYPDAGMKFVGEWVLPMATGAGVWSMGRRALVGGLRMLAPRLAAAGSSFLAEQGAAIAARAASLGDAALPAAGKAGLETAAEVAGGALASGGLSGAGTAAEGGSPGEIAKSAALGAAITGGVDVGLRGAAQLALRTLGGGTIHDPGVVRDRVAGWRAEVAAPQAAELRRVADAASHARHGQEVDLVAARWLGASDSEVGAMEGELRKLSMVERHAETAAQGMEAVRDVDDSIVSNMLRTRAGSWARTPDEVQRFLLRWTMTPEGFARNSGSPTLLAVGKMASAGEATLSIHASAAQVAATEMYQGLGKGWGLRGSSKAYQERVANIFHDYESMPWDKFRRTHPEAVPTLERFRRIDTLYDEVARRGGHEKLQLGRMGPMQVENYVPHVLNPDIPEAEMRRRFRDGTVRFYEGKGKTKLEAEALADTHLARLAERLRNPVKADAADFTRELPGTLKELVDAGVPFVADPVRAWNITMNSIARRHVYAGIAGWKNELVPRFTSMAIADMGPQSEAVANTFMHGVFEHNIATEGWRRIAQNAISAQTFTKMTFGFLGNLTQPLNVGLYQGTRAMAKGYYDTLRRATPKVVEEAGAVNESVFQAAMRVYEGTGSESWLDRIARHSMGPFNVVERSNKRIAGSASYYDIRKTLEQAVRGRLRGRTLEAARKRFGDYNLDLAGIVERARPLHRAGATLDEILEDPSVLSQRVVRDGQLIQPGALDIAIHRGMQVTQFTSDKMRRPFGWQTPGGRVLAQYKSFGIQQGRAIRDTVLRAAAEGNYGPLAYFMTTFPVVGHALRATVNGIRGRDPDESDNAIAQYLGDLTALGGFGLAGSLMTSAQYGKTWDALAGPTGSDMIGFVEAVGQAAPKVMEGDLKGALADPVGSYVTRTPVFQGVVAVLGGALAGSQALQRTLTDAERKAHHRAVDEFLESNSDEMPATDMHDYMEERVRRKGMGDWVR